MIIISTKEIGWLINKNILLKIIEEIIRISFMQEIV